ncbi:MAG TPA: DUF2393 family protein [Acidobacteriaceae bacterium]|jgi:hypothetical protein|nr:DUF2393 family protein [Acidobacteriaceae bacterium]
MEPKFAASESAAARERNWAPAVIAAAIVIAAVLMLWLTSGRIKPDAGSSSGAPDPYAASLPITELAMSEAANMVGGKVTYVSGHIANTGSRTVTGVTVQVVFRDYKKEVAQSQRMPLTVIRMREPYIDTALLSVSPLKPGGATDFRLNFDTVSPEWAGTMPEVQIVRVDSK